MKLADRFAAFLFKRNWRGAVRFHKNICHGRPLAFRTKHGVELELDPYEYIDRLVFQNGFYEEEVLEAVQKNLRSGDVFWDIGANLGLHALTVAKLTPATKVFAFEPNSFYARKLEKAAAANNCRVDVLEYALDSTEGKVTFYVHQGNSGRSSLHDWHDDPTVRPTEVNAIRGDSLVTLKGLPVPNVIKIDVEGNEARVFQGMPSLLANPNLRVVVFEDATEDKTPVKEILRRNGFAIDRLLRRENTHHPLENYTARRA